MALMKVVLLLILTLANANATCNTTVISQIFSLWNDNPPTNFIEWGVGTITSIWVTSNYIYDPLHTTCFQQTIYEDKVSMTYYQKIGNGSTEFRLDYNIIMEEPGEYSLIYPSKYNFYDRNLFPAFLRNDVVAYYYCTPLYDGYSIISSIDVRNYDRNDKTQTDDILAAKIVLAKLKLDEDFIMLGTDCP